MDIKFDAKEAEKLIKQMNGYCLGIVMEARELLNIVGNSDEWNDNQAKAFQNNIEELAKDLNKALALESEYMRTFDQRVKELRG